MTRRANPPKQRELHSAQTETITASVRALPWAVKSPQVRSAVEGDRMPELFTGDRPFVQRRCELDPTGIFYCLPCRQLLWNVAQLDMHTERGPHTIARICESHGAETI